MANEQHRIQVILEAFDRGSNNIRKFFENNRKELESFRDSAREVNKEIDIIFTAGGPRGRGPGGQLIKLSEGEKALANFRQIRAELKKISDESRRASPIGSFLTAFTEGRQEANAIREAINQRAELSKEAQQKERDELDKHRRQLRRELTATHAKERQQLESNEILKIKIEKAALIRRERDLAGFYQDRIDAARKAAIREGAVVANIEESADRKRANTHRKRILELERERDAEIETLRSVRRERDRGLREEFDADTRAQRREIANRDLSKIAEEATREFTEARRQAEAADRSIIRFGRNAGRAWSEFRLGASLGRQELSEADREFVRSRGNLVRLGVAFGAAFRGANQFINIRWAIVISFIQILLTLVVQFGLALVALASSAIQAGAALGGALLAGVTQLIPAVGLLAAAFSRLNVVLDAAKIAEKLRITGADEIAERADAITNATDRLADARFALVKAGEAVKDAEFDLAQAGEEVKDALENQRDAIKGLAEARKEAARDIVDANLEEKEASLDLEDAILGVAEARRRLREEQQKDQLLAQNISDTQAQIREARDRLAQARKEGDQEEISLALAQLNVAEQNLQRFQEDAREAENNVKQAQIDVRQAENNRAQAAIRSKRAEEDAAEARRKGIEGSEKVQQAQKNLAQATENIAQAERQQVLAQRALRDAVHNLTLARREQQRAEEDLTESQKKQSAQQEQLQQQLADLSPAERNLFRSIRRLQDRYRTLFRPITDIIINSFARAIDRILIILQDTRIISAIRRLSTSIASAIDAISEFGISPEFRNFLVFTIENAAKNVPKLTAGFIDLFRVLIRIARVATPLFNDLLDRFVRFASRLEEGTRNTSRIENFFAVAGRHLDSWIAFGGAVARVLGLIIKLSAPAGEGLLGDLTNKLNEWADWLDANEHRVLEFFSQIQTTVTALARTLGAAIAVLFEAFTSEEQSELTQFILETLLPAFTLFLQILGKLAAGFNALTDIPLIGELIKFAATIIIVEKLFNRLIPATQKLTNAFFALMRIAFSGQALAAIRNWIQLMRASIILARQGQLANALAAGGFVRLAVAIRATAAAFTALRAAAVAALLTPPVGIVVLIAAVVAALVVLELKFGIVSKAIEGVLDAFRSLADFFVNHWKTVVLAAILAPFSPFLAGGVFLVRFRRTFIEAGQAVINFFKNNWSQLITLISLPFAGTANIIRFRNEIINSMRQAASSVVNFFRDIPRDIERNLSRIDDVYNELIRRAREFGRDFAQGIIDGIKDQATNLKDAVVGFVEGAVDFAKDALGISSPSRVAYSEIGIPMGQGIKEGALDGVSGLGSAMTLVLRREFFALEVETNNIKNRISGSLEGLQGLVSQQLQTRLGGLTPAEKELERLDKAETERGRKQEITDAAKTVNESKREVQRAQRELARAQKAFNNADTAEKKKKARDDLALAKQNAADAQKNLEAALRQQAETERRIGVDRRRERLQELARQQREELEKSVAAEQRRADGMFRALRTALNNKNWDAVQKIFNRIVDLVGIKNLGKATADEYVAGLVNQLRILQPQVTKAIKNQNKQAQIQATREATASRAILDSGKGQTGVTVGRLKQQGLSDREIISFLINNDLLDKTTAISIARNIGGDAARVSFREVIKNGKLNVEMIKFVNKLKDPKITKPNFVSFLSKFGGRDSVLKAFSDALEELQVFQSGGTVRGGEGQPVPIIAHAGEWVLNKMQQMKLSQRLGEPLSAIQEFLFGGNKPKKGKPGPSTTGTRPTSKEQGFRGTFYDLVPQQDDFGEVLWFIQIDDGQHVQIRSDHAKRIKATDGAWIPPWLMRRGLYTKKWIPDQIGRGLAEGGVVQKFLNGGIVMPRFSGPMLQSFAEGGTVLNQSTFGSPSASNTKNITQNFEVKTDGETDWNYVLRLGAMHAKSSYT